MAAQQPVYNTATYATSGQIQAQYAPGAPPTLQYQTGQYGASPVQQPLQPIAQPAAYGYPTAGYAGGPAPYPGYPMTGYGAPMTARGYAYSAAPSQMPTMNTAYTGPGTATLQERGSGFRKVCLIFGILHLLLAALICAFEIWTIVAINLFQSQWVFWPPGMGLWAGTLIWAATGGISLWVAWKEKVMARFALAVIVACGLSLLVAAVLLLLLILSVAMKPYAVHLYSAYPKFVVIPLEGLIALVHLILSERFYLFKWRARQSKKRKEQSDLRHKDKEREMQKAAAARVDGLWSRGETPLIGQIPTGAPDTARLIPSSTGASQPSMRAAIAEKGRAKAALPPTPPPEEQQPQMSAYNGQLAFNAELNANPNTLNPMYRDGTYMAQSAGADVISVPPPQPAPPMKQAKPLPAAPFTAQQQYGYQPPDAGYTASVTMEGVHYTAQAGGGADDDFGGPPLPPKGGVRSPY